MNIADYSNKIPIGYANRQTLETEIPDDESRQIVTYIRSEKSRAEQSQHEIRKIWDDCWALYRGKEDFSDKQDWQSKLVIPKPFNSVKQAVNAFVRMLELSQKPWELEPANPDDEVTKQRAERIERLINYFMDEAEFLKAFEEGLESATISGLGVWKIWWSLDTRTKLATQQDEQGQVQLVKQFFQEGKLKIKAIDPYNFYWIPGGGLNNWLGTIEESWISLYQLRRMADQEIIDKDKIKNLVGHQTSTVNAQVISDSIRFDKPNTVNTGVTPGMTMVKLTEYYGPLLDKEGNLIMENAYVVLANDDVVLKVQENPYWHSRPPYVAFSPLLVPFREEGIGLVEMTREIDRGLSRLANMSMDTLMFRLLPTFEAYPEAYEDDTELDTGMIPGKIFRRNRMGFNLPPLTPLLTEDISSGAVQIMAMLDRYHQEGSLISELQESMPRFRGNQTAAEVNVKANRENSFISALAREIDDRAIKPMIEMIMDTVMQHMDTTGDPRIASILGIGVEELNGLDPIQLMEIVQGDYLIRVHGVNEQIEKVEILENLIQFMNVIGQNAEWLPYINQSELFKRILDSFPNIRDTDYLVNDPATVEAQRLALQNSQLSPEIIRAAPGLLRSYAQMHRDGVIPNAMPALQQNADNQARAAQQQQQEALQMQNLEKDVVIAELEARLAEAERSKRGDRPAGKAITKPKE